MALMIVNDEIEQLAHELARQTGEPVPQVILDALQERIRSLQAQRAEVHAVARIRRAAQRCAAVPDQQIGATDDILGYAPDGTFDPW